MRIVRTCGAVLGLLVLGGAEVRAQSVAFQPVVGSFPNGVMMSATPVVSYDRRYVRLGVNAQFNGLLGFDTFLVPGAASGGGAGGAGGAGAGLPGLAGMNGAGAGPARNPAPPLPAGGPRIAVDSGAFFDPVLAAREASQQRADARSQKTDAAKSLKGIRPRPGRIPQRPAPVRPRG